MNTTTLMLPGIGNSGPGHWQSLWEAAHPSFVRVQQGDWDHPDAESWVRNLEKALSGLDGDAVLVAHSLGCTLVALWAAQTGHTVRGALLVAPPDPDNPAFPREARGFAPMPMAPLAFPSLLIMSCNDPYASPAFAASTARAWGSRLVDIGATGHINADSGLGAWEEGFALYEQLVL